MELFWAQHIAMLLVPPLLAAHVRLSAYIVMITCFMFSGWSLLSSDGGWAWYGLALLCCLPPLPFAHSSGDSCICLFLCNSRCFHLWDTYITFQISNPGVFCLYLVKIVAFIYLWICLWKLIDHISPPLFLDSLLLFWPGSIWTS